MAKTVHVWIPSGVKVLRGAVLYQDMSFKDWTTAYGEPWRSVAAAWQFALVTTDYGVKQDTTFFFQKLREQADSTGHSELPNLPFCVFGHSASALGAMEFAMLFPKRTIAVHSNHVRWQVDPTTDPEMLKMPLIALYGETDELVNLQNSLQQAFRGRKMGAPWCIAIQWKTGHSFADCFTIGRAFFDEMIRMRLPQTPAAGPIVLKDIDPAQGWLGDTTAWRLNPFARVEPCSSFTGDKSSASWLSSEGFAGVWRAFNARYIDIAFSPYSINGLTVRAGQSLTLSVLLRTISYKQVRFFDGGTLLGESDSSTSMTWDVVPEGVHTCYAVITTTSGAKLSSKPSQIIATSPVLGIKNSPPGRGSVQRPGKTALTYTSGSRCSLDGRSVGMTARSARSAQLLRSGPID